MPKQRSAASGGHYDFIDLLRIAACFLVIVNHTNSGIFSSSTPSMLNWWGSITYFFISKPAVPLFIMISGFTLVDKRDTRKKSLTRIARTLIVLFAFTVLYFFAGYFLGKIPELSLSCFLELTFPNGIANAFWYLYAYLGILIMLPFIQKAVTAFSRGDVRIFIAISLLFFSLYPVLLFYYPRLNFSVHINLDMFCSYVCFLMIGYYFKKYAKMNRLNFLIAVSTYFLMLFFNVFSTYRLYQRTGGIDYLFFDNIRLLPIVLQAVSMFYIAMYLFIDKKLGKTVTALGACTFGIYLFSDLFILNLGFINAFWISLGIPRLIAIFMYQIMVFALGFIATYILRLIPFLKKLL